MTFPRSISDAPQALPVRCEDACARSGAPHAGALALVQLLALSTMLVDHLGAVGLLGEWSRLVGRFAMPAFVVLIALNALQARLPRVMFLRCLGLLFISQPLWWFSVGSFERLCILVTLLAVVALVWCWRSRSPLEGSALLLAFFAVSPWVEYGPWPLLLLPLVVRPSLLTLSLALVWPLVQYLGQPIFQASAVASLLLLLLILLRVRFDVPRPPRYATRYFYPWHLFLIGLTKLAN